MNFRTLFTLGSLSAVLLVPALASAQTYYPAPVYQTAPVVGTPVNGYYSQYYAPQAYYAPGQYYAPQAYYAPQSYYAPGYYSAPYIRRDWDHDHEHHGFFGFFRR